MIDLQLAADSFPVWKAIAWMFYPMGVLVAIELYLKSLNDDDDDDEGGGVMTPVYQGA
tara:strand:- start:679 stop:852 length:174 start_codon:yes stop_codon:yes gene_type:complete